MDHTYGNVPLNQNQRAMPEASPSRVKGMVQKLQDTEHGIMGRNALQREQEIDEGECDLIYDDTEVIPVEKHPKVPQVPKRKADVGKSGTKPSPSQKLKNVKPKTNQKQRKPPVPEKINKPSAPKTNQKNDSLTQENQSQKEPDLEYADVDDEDADKAAKPLIAERNANNKSANVPGHTSAMHRDVPQLPMKNQGTGLCKKKRCKSVTCILIVILLVITLLNTGVIIFLVVNFTQSSKLTSSGTGKLIFKFIV